MKKVFLLGDSIRENYQEKVIEKLGEGYQVFYPDENCRFSAYTLNCLRYWFEPVPEDIDVIHWNNGLWDTAFLNDEGVPFLSIDDYIKYMQRILISLRSRRPKAKIILATITPTRKEKENDAISKHYLSVIEKYNEKLVETLKNQVDDINDLFKIVLPEMDRMICDDYVHLTEYGKEKCSTAVVESIKKIIKE